MRELVYAAIRAAGERAGERARGDAVAGRQRDAALAATFDGSPHGPAPIVRGRAGRARPGVAPAGWSSALRASGIDRAPNWPRWSTARRSTSASTAARQLDDVLRASTARADRRPARRAAPAGRHRRRPTLRRARRGAGRGQPDRRRSRRGREPGQQDRRSVRRARAARRWRSPRRWRTRARSSPATPIAARLSRLAAARRARGRDDRRDAVARIRQRDARRWPTGSGSADVVLIDAPCSGTGTWRRNPGGALAADARRGSRGWSADAGACCSTSARRWSGRAARWSTSSARCSTRRARGRSAPSWRDTPAGRPSRSTCPPAGRMAPGVRLTPASDGTDGFFVARLRAPC